MEFLTLGTALIDRLRRRRTLPRLPIQGLRQLSWPELISTRLKPGQKTWLVARAVSLRAF